MRVATAAAVAIAASSPALAAAPPVPIPGGPVQLPPAGATARALPSGAGARPVELRITFRQELRCGRLRGPLLRVALPAAFRLPGRIDPAAVRVAGKAPTRVSVTGRVITLGLAPQRGILCDSIAVGRVTVVFAKDAGLGNPARPGRYRVAVTAGGETAVALVAIR